MADPFAWRSERRFDEEAQRRVFANKSVLITGAAGSIGSALAIKLAAIGCRHLHLLDHFDHGLLDIYEAVRRISPAQPVTDILCDVRDEGRLEACMRRAEPDIVIHAAALKHVHLGERHSIECVLTNLIGVRNALSAAETAGASQFLLISSDKAAAPVCLMGATKRLAELYLAGYRAENPEGMCARSVRFGNVVGTQGSVIPRFAAQIEAGGPLEVTHADMERFFMTPGEAVGFILSVAALPDDKTASAYVMEMGEAISILELGRDMIRKSGKEIAVTFTGLRPGERIKECLFDDHEAVTPSKVEGVFRVTSGEDAFVSTADVAHIEGLARSMDNPVVRQRVFAFLNRRIGRTERAVG